MVIYLSISAQNVQTKQHNLVKKHPRKPEKPKRHKRQANPPKPTKTRQSPQNPNLTQNP